MPVSFLCSPGGVHSVCLCLSCAVQVECTVYACVFPVQSRWSASGFLHQVFRFLAISKTYAVQEN